MTRLLLLPAILGFSLPCLAANRVALVIGNSAYSDARLPNPVSDAKVVAASLEKADFKVILKTDLSREGMRAAIREFSNNLGKDDTALFYYAGHGAQVKDENYLLPVDAPLEMKEFEADDRSVKINLAFGAMEECGSTLNIVILDCCRNNPFARSWRSATRGLAEMKAPQETLIAYATAPGKTASDGEGSNSPYSQALAEEILRPGVKLQDVFLNVARRVHATTKGEQRPWTSSDLLSEFVFVAAKPPPPEPEPASAPPAPMPVPASVAAVVTSASVPSQGSPPATALETPTMPVLPERGFFDLDSLFTGGPYAGYNSYSRSHILKQAQTKFKSVGHYTSSADGTPGPGTQRAILAYQQAQHLPLSGRLDTATVQSMGLADIQPIIAPKPATSPRTTRRSPSPTVPANPLQPPQPYRTESDVLFGR